MNELTIYQFKKNPVRIIRDAQNELWWIAKDVCDVLGLLNITEATRSIDNHDLSKTEVTDQGGIKRHMIIVNEPGLYQLILRSNKPEAKEFQYWVTHEVLPSIRKTGSYSVNQSLLEQSILAIADSVKIIAQATANNTLDIVELKKQVSEIKQLPSATPVFIATQMTTRSKLRRLVNTYGREHHATERDYQIYWNTIFNELFYRDHINLKLQAKNHNMSNLDMAEKLGLMEELYAIANEIFTKVTA